MTFKNAFKLLVTKFGYVWAILLYILILAAVLFTLSLTFLIPIMRAFRDAGIGDSFNVALLSFFDGATLKQTYDSFAALVGQIKEIFAADSRASVNTVLFVVLVMNVALRFLLGLYELPIVSVIQGFMSDNARYGFVSRYVSLLGRSAKFSAIKMVVMTVFDFAMWGTIYGLTLLGAKIAFLLAPFFFMLSLILLLSVRFTLVSAWSPAVVVEGKGVFAGLLFALKHAARNFGSLFSVFMVVWVILLAINVIIGLFTFLAGLVVTVPVTLYLVSLINMTSYYGKNGKSYYIDGAVYVPETQPKKEKKSK